MKNIGIDLGTTNSCASVYNSVGEMPQIIKVDGQVLVPSCVKLENGELKVHYAIYNEKYKTSVAYSIKRSLGIEDTISLTDEVTGEVKSFSPKHLSSVILKKIKEEIEVSVGTVEDVTITVPARFSVLQKQLTQEAGIEAGFKSVSIINEPTSAALAYKLEAKGEAEVDENILIFDLGGGTFDVSVLSLIPSSQVNADCTKESGETDFLQDFYGMSEAVETKNKSVVKVISSNGDPQLGGDDIDVAILRKIYFDSSLLGVDLDTLRPVGTTQYKELLLRVENFKKNNMGGTMRIQKEDGTLQEISVTVSQIEHGYRRIMRKAMGITRTCIEQAGVKIDKIVLVGGSTKSPIVSKLLREEFGNITILSAFNPDEVVGLGASVSSAVRNGTDDTMEFIDVTPYTIGVRRSSGALLPIILKDSVLPATGSTMLNVVTDGAAYVQLFTTDTNDMIGSVTLPELQKGEKVTVQLFVNKDSLLTCRAKVKKEVYDIKVDLANLSKSTDITDGDSRYRKRVSNYSGMSYEMFINGHITEAEHLKNASVIEEFKDAEDKEAFFLNKSKHFKKLKKTYTNFLIAKGNESKLVASSGGVEVPVEEFDVPQSRVFQ